MTLLLKEIIHFADLCFDGFFVSGSEDRNLAPLLLLYFEVLIVGITMEGQTQVSSSVH